jgi:hypothetical protein
MRDDGYMRPTFARGKKAAVAKLLELRQQAQRDKEQRMISTGVTRVTAGRIHFERTLDARTMDTLARTLPSGSTSGLRFNGLLSQLASPHSSSENLTHDGRSSGARATHQELHEMTHQQPSVSSFQQRGDVPQTLRHLNR